MCVSLLLIYAWVSYSSVRMPPFCNFCSCGARDTCRYMNCFDGWKPLSSSEAPLWKQGTKNSEVGRKIETHYFTLLIFLGSSVKRASADERVAKLFARKFPFLIFLQDPTTSKLSAGFTWSWCNGRVPRCTCIKLENERRKLVHTSPWSWFRGL